MKFQIETDIAPHILAELEADKPSDDPAYWAKSSCKNCFGRGIIGTIKTTFAQDNTLQQKLLCDCARKKYRKWLEKKFEERRKLKSDLSPENHSQM